MRRVLSIILTILIILSIFAIPVIQVSAEELSQVTFVCSVPDTLRNSKDNFSITVTNAETFDNYTIIFYGYNQDYSVMEGLPKGSYFVSMHSYSLHGYDVDEFDFLINKQVQTVNFAIYDTEETLKKSEVYNADNEAGMIDYEKTYGMTKEEYLKKQEELNNTSTPKTTVTTNETSKPTKQTEATQPSELTEQTEPTETASDPELEQQGGKSIWVKVFIFVGLVVLIIGGILLRRKYSNIEK